MSADTPGNREVAYRIFAAEYEDATLEHAESDEERAPTYVVTPTGARVNRLFLVGVLTEVTPVNEEMLRARIVDQTGAFVSYAGQYQPDARAALERTDPPAFLAVTGKARTFEPDDADVVYTSVRPESVTVVDADTRDRFTVTAAEHALERVGIVAAGIQSGLDAGDLRAALDEAGVPEGIAAGVPLALDHYGTGPAYLAAIRDLALDAARVVAGDRDEVPPLDVAPDDPGDADLDELAALAPFDGPLEPPADAVSSPSATDESETIPPADGEPDSAAAGTATGSERETVDDPEEVEAAAESEDSVEFDADLDDPDPDEEDRSDPDEEDDDLDGEDGDDAPDGMYEIDDEERERIEAEYGTDFTTASEVDEPGEAGIETPDPEPEEADTDEVDEAPNAGDADEAADRPSDPEDDSESTDDDIDLEDAVMDVMRELADGGGADRETVLARVVDEHGANPDDVEEAIQSALMGGRCYEPDENTLQPI